jgi:hypothetical protein
MEEDLSDESPAKEGGKLLRILEKALDRGALDPVLLDVREVASFADVFVLLSGRSDRQARAIADAVVEAMRDAADAPRIDLPGLGVSKEALAAASSEDTETRRQTEGFL